MSPVKIFQLLTCLVAAFVPAVAALAADRIPKTNAPRAIIITSDTGADMDDEWTIAQAALAPEIEVRGIITGHAPSLAPPAAETAARHARTLLEKMPLRSRPPVFAGSNVSLGTNTVGFTNSGVGFLIAQSRLFTSEKRLAVLILGAATDVASALLLDPTLADRIEVIAMAFNRWPEGTDSWNVRNDVRAWQVLMHSRTPITIGDAAVTARDLSLNRKQVRELFRDRGAAGEFLIQLHTKWLDRDPPFIQRITGDRDTWPIWDSVTLAHLLELTTSEVRPRPRLGDDMKFLHGRDRSEKDGAIRWITAIDSPRLWHHFVAQLEAATQAQATPKRPLTPAREFAKSRPRYCTS